MQICLFSRHIPKSSTDADTILSDIAVFNAAKRTAYSLSRQDRDFDRTCVEKGRPDLRRKENRHLRETMPESIHMQLKKRYGLNDYFANSANQAAKGVLRSVKELHADNVKVTKEKLSAVSRKLKKKTARLEQLQKTKGDLVKISRCDKAAASGKPTGKRPKLRMPKGGVETWDKSSGVFTIWRFDRKKGVKTPVRTFADTYQFESQYLDPGIKRLKHTVSLLQGRIRRLEAKLSRMEKEPGVCFGSKKFFRKQHTIYEDDHEVWKRRFLSRRNHCMTISGRRDSRDGNFVFRYEPKTHTLYYRSIEGKEVVIREVFFPYGQKFLEDYLARQKEERHAPIAWSIEDTRGSFLIKCMVEAPAALKNFCYENGCISVDTNVDCFAAAETDASGNLLHHRIFPFDIRGCSSAQAEQILSKTLDQIFAWCVDTNKPLAMEDLKKIDDTKLYGDKGLNRKLSGFAYTKIRQLAASKSRRYHTDVRFVSPAYTSQMGKVKYMGRYGLSVHEAAALVIGRRAMGFKEKLPGHILSNIPAEKIARHHWAHWQHIHKTIKMSLPSLFYRRLSRPRPPNLADDLPF